MDTIQDFLGTVVVLILGIAWSFGGLVGAIYWAIQENFLFIVLSLFIPMFGAISTIGDLLL